jgi:hypothetical protein
LFAILCETKKKTQTRQKLRVSSLLSVEAGIDRVQVVAKSIRLHYDRWIQLQIQQAIDNDYEKGERKRQQTKALT